MVVQVTKKPVNFTEEAKELFKYLPDISKEIIWASYNIDSAIDRIDGTIAGSREVGMVGTDAVRSAQTELDIALSKILGVKSDIRILIKRDLLRDDLDVVNSLLENLNNAIKCIEEAHGKLVIINTGISEGKHPSPSTIEGFKRAARRAILFLYDASRDMDTLCELYHYDPPELGDLLSLGKVVGIGVGALVVVGAILKYLNNR